MGNITSVIPGPFDKACSGKKGGVMYRFECNNKWEACYADGIGEEYNGKKIKCGAIYTDGGVTDRKLKKMILVDDDECSGFCNTLLGIPIIGNILSQLCHKLKKYIMIGGFLVGVFLFFISLYLISKKYYKSVIFTGGLSFIAIFIAVLTLVL
jgi:hypothetical protein